MASAWHSEHCKQLVLYLTLYANLMYTFSCLILLSSLTSKPSRRVLTLNTLQKKKKQKREYKSWKSFLSRYCLITDAVSSSKTCHLQASFSSLYHIYQGSVIVRSLSLLSAFDIVFCKSSTPEVFFFSIFSINKVHCHLVAHVTCFFLFFFPLGLYRYLKVNKDTELRLVAKSSSK